MRIPKFIFLALFATACILSGCSTAPKDPTAIAETFAKAYYAGDFDKCNKLSAKELFTPEGEMNKSEKEMTKAMKEYSKKMGYQLALDNDETEIEEEKATVVFTVTAKGAPDFEEEGWVKLKKNESDKWKVVNYKLRGAK